MGVGQLLEGDLMKAERFEREKRYQVMVAIYQKMLRQGVLSEEDFAQAERFLREKYQPVFTAS